MTRTVLITGSQGFLGRALRAAFTALGDRVIGVDLPGTGAEIEFDLDGTRYGAGVEFCELFAMAKWDVVICNAKCKEWFCHNELAKLATSCIVNVSSIYGVLGNDPKMYTDTEVAPTPAWYAASKAALVGLTRWQACNLAPVRSNCICPGGISRGHSSEFVERYIAKVPLRRMATEAEIVEPIIFLCSDASRYITGQVLMADGGLSCMA